MDKHKVGNCGVGGYRDFGLRMLFPSGFLVLLLVLVGSLPGGVFVPAMVIAGAGLLTSGPVGFFTGIRGPFWLIYGLIFTELAVWFLLPDPWRGLAPVCVPASAIGFLLGKEIAFFHSNRRQQVSATTWVVAGDGIADVAEAKRRGLSRLENWESLKDGRFVVALGHRRFEAWGSAGDGFIVHAARDGRDFATLGVLARVPHQNEEVSIPLDTRGLTGWVPLGVKVPAQVAVQALDGFFETQGAMDLPGWAWEYGAQAEDLRFV